MVKYVIVYINDHSMPPEIRSMTNILLKKLYSRFDHLENNEVVMQLTLLDPRFKKQGFPSDRKYQLAYESLSRTVMEYL